MFEKLKNSQQFNFAKQKLKLVGARLADQHISLAVTGLSRSGKTAFITSLVNQLLEAKDSAVLPFFSVQKQGRLYGARREGQPDLSVSRFTYEEGMDKLNSQPPCWPSPTNGVSQIRLRLKYRHQGGLRRMLAEDGQMILDITDYPGEWLLDLPLLQMSYRDWCLQFWQDMEDEHRASLAVQFLSDVKQLQSGQSGDENLLQSLTKSFTDYLHQAKAQGYQLIQPGRFVLPGELEGAPVLQFFPVPMDELNADTLDWQAPAKGSNADLLVMRFEHYKSQVIKPFYRDHFSGFDRQVVLVDCLSALNQGAHSFNDLQKAINWLLGSFHYGKSNILKRLFSPKIDKLVFAATKADHVTPDQQENLVKLLESMLHSARQDIQFEGVITESTAIAAIRASTSGTSLYQGEQLNVLHGRNEAGEGVTLFPGEVPSTCPDPKFWQNQGFDFPHFAAPSREPLCALPHIRMDQILEFLLADKLA
jgi:predicted YcjX-like family ATPase